MLYGALIGDVHTIRDFGLLPTAPFLASPPEEQRYEIEIPGLDGTIDLTESTDGHVHYKNRTLPMPHKCIAPREEWSAIYSRLLNAVHGRRVKIILDEDKSHYYVGRVSVQPPDLQKKQWYVNITANVDPFKYELYSSTEHWLWDPFDFNNGIAREYDGLEFDGEETIAIPASPAVKIITVEVTEADEAFTLHYGDSDYALAAYLDKPLILPVPTEGSFDLSFSGAGRISIIFKGGRL